MDTLTDSPAKKYKRFVFITATRTWRFYTEEEVYPDVAVAMFCEKTGLPASAIMTYYAEE